MVWFERYAHLFKPSPRCSGQSTDSVVVWCATGSIPDLCNTWTFPENFYDCSHRNPILAVLRMWYMRRTLCAIFGFKQSLGWSNSYHWQLSEHQVRPTQLYILNNVNTFRAKNVYWFIKLYFWGKWAHNYYFIYME